MIVLLDKKQRVLYFESRPSPVATGDITTPAEHNSFYNNMEICTQV